jgi:trigger factor
MTDYKVTHLPHSEVKIEFIVDAEDARPYLEEAAREMSEAKPLPGFRPGKVSYEDAKRAYGEMKILEVALERVVRAHYVKAILAEHLDTIGAPAISIEQLVPGQEIKFTVTAPIEPQVIAFPDFAKCQVTKKTTDIKEESVNEAVEQMRKMRRKEARVDRAATNDDLVVIDMAMEKDHVAIEGGSGTDYKVYLGESHYIPGFTKELSGIKEGEERTFSIKFPEDHFQKHLAGQPVDVKAKAKGVFEMQLPELNDEFAKGVGVESLEKLRELLKQNMTAESQQKADEAAEIEMLEKLTDAAKFSDIPEILVNEEVRRMMGELEHGVEEQGMKWDDYLASIKKTNDQLKMDFLPQAMRRIKTAVLIKNIAKKEHLEVSEKEIEEEADRLLQGIKPEDQETRERIASPEFHEYMTVQMRNRKALEWVRQQCVK